MNIRQVENLKRHLDAEHKKDIEAIERVLALLQKSSETTGAGPASVGVAATSGDNGAVRVRGVDKALRRALSGATDNLTKDVIHARLEEVEPDKAAKVKPASLRNAIRHLERTGFIEKVPEESTAQRPVYRRIFKSKETETDSR